MRVTYADDPTAQGIFELAGRALADPSQAEPRRAFWKFCDMHSSHEWVNVLVKLAAASHPLGVAPGQEMIREATEDARHKVYAGQPDWLRGAFRLSSDEPDRPDRQPIETVHRTFRTSA